MEFSITDTLRQSIEIMSGGKNTVMYDDQGNPNIMVCVPKYDASVLGLKAGTHPAFIIDDDHNEVNEIWVGKYHAARGDNGGSMVWHETLPYGDVTFVEAKEACKKKGKGWHLMTNLEWSAVSLLAWKNGHNHPGSGSGINNPGSYMMQRTGLTRDNATEMYLSSCNNITQSTDGATTGIFNMGGLARDYVDGLYLGNQEILHFWGDKETLSNPINCFENERYVDNNFTLDCGKDGILYINRDQGRDSGTSYHQAFAEAKPYEPHMDSNMIDMCRKLLVLPTPGMNNTNVWGKFGWGRVNENVKLHAVRGIDIWNNINASKSDSIPSDMFNIHFFIDQPQGPVGPQYSFRPVYINTK